MNKNRIQSARFRCDIFDAIIRIYKIAELWREYEKPAKKYKFLYFYVTTNFYRLKYIF